MKLFKTEKEKMKIVLIKHYEDMFKLTDKEKEELLLHLKSKNWDSHRANNVVGAIINGYQLYIGRNRQWTNIYGDNLSRLDRLYISSIHVYDGPTIDHVKNYEPSIEYMLSIGPYEHALEYKQIKFKTLEELVKFVTEK